MTSRFTVSKFLVEISAQLIVELCLCNCLNCCKKPNVMVRSHIFFDSLIPPKTLLKNRRRSEIPVNIYKQMKNSVFIVRNL